MKQYSFYFQLSVCSLLTACQSSPGQPTAASATDIPGLTVLSGTWVGHHKAGFILVEINQDSTGTYTRFNDAEKYLGKKVLGDRYSFYKSPIRVKYKPNRQHGPQVAIQTVRFRFDYKLAGDTLREYDKIGYRGSLVRMKPDKIYTSE